MKLYLIFDEFMLICKTYKKSREEVSIIIAQYYNLNPYLIAYIWLNKLLKFNGIRVVYWDAFLVIEVKWWWDSERDGIKWD